MNEWNMREVKEVRWHKRKWRCATAVKQITGRADCDSMWEKMVYMKTLILSGGRGACRHSSTQTDQRRFKERNTVNERCVLFPFCEIVADNHLQHTSGITALILSAVKWFYRASFPSRCFLLLDFTTFLLHETSSHLRCRVHQEEFFWGGNGMYEMWYRSRSGAACLRVLIYSTTRVRVFFASRPVSSLAHISIYVTTKKTPRPVGLLSLRHSKTKSQASAQKHTWHLQALTHSYDPPALTETQRTRLQLAEAQSCVGVSHFFTSKSQKLTETKNGFKTETARNQWAKQPHVDGVPVQVCTCERLMHRDDDTKIHTSLFTTLCLCAGIRTMCSRGNVVQKEKDV